MMQKNLSSDTNKQQIIFTNGEQTPYTHKSSQHSLVTYVHFNLKKDSLINNYGIG